jgi:hypothetical protein
MIGIDKITHVGAGAIAAAPAFFGALHLMHEPLGNARIAGMALCAIAALAKEAYNRRTGGVWDWWDIAATLVGGVLVVG